MFKNQKLNFSSLLFTRSSNEEFNAIIFLRSKYWSLRVYDCSCTLYCTILVSDFLDVGVHYYGLYVAIFMGMKSVHLELVSDLTTEAFVAGLKRLFSGRGMSNTIYSDKSTNFVSVSRKLVGLYKLLQSTENNESVQNS